MASFYGQLVIGPAGSGKKSTYCHTIQTMGQTLKRNLLVCNLDPAAEHFSYGCDIDIRDLITLEDVMEEMQLGPNGGLIFCMEYLLQNWDWMQEKMNGIGMDDYVLFDCPGQIELYTHLPIMSQIARQLANMGFSLATIYMLDVNFIADDSKYISGILMAISSQMTIELPHFTILSKCDLVENKNSLKKFLKLHKFNQESEFGVEQDVVSLNGQFEKNYKGFSKSLHTLIQVSGFVRLLALDLQDEDTIYTILSEIDYSIQWGENVEPDDKMYDAIEKKLLNQQFANIEM